MVDFMQEYLGQEINERIKEKFALIENDILFKYAIDYGYLQVEDKEKELKYYKEHIKKLEQYLLECGYKQDYLNKFKSECVKKTKTHFNRIRISREILGIRRW